MSLFNFKKIASCFLIVSVLFFGVLSETQARESRAGSVETLYQKAQRSYYQLKNSKKKQAYRHHWMACIQKFVTVYESNPSSPQAYKALFTVARLYHQLYGVAKNSRDRERALHFYYKVISEYKAGRLTDDALFHQGKINFDKKNYSEALASFENILRDFPRGDQVVKARKLKQKIVSLVPPRQVVQAKSRIRAAKPVLLKKVVYSQQPNSTQVVIHIGGPAKITQNRLSNPERVYFNFLNTRLDQRIKKDIQVGSDTLKRLRVSQFDKTTSRLVLEIPANREIQVVTTRKEGKLVVDLIASDKKPGVSAKTKITPIIKPVPVAIAPSAKRVARKGVPLIVIDPGHGGKDIGAKSRRGLLENDVNLKISKRLKKILESRYGYQVILTRNGDESVPLENRPEFATRQKADLFVSVHINSSSNRNLAGFETYYLDLATDPTAAETAFRENDMGTGGIGNLDEVLNDIVKNANKRESRDLAQSIQDSLVLQTSKRYPDVRDLGVKHAPFVVLIGAAMPAVLVECSFLSNEEEEQRLRDPDYRQQIADAIHIGIANYGSRRRMVTAAH